jgi:hypothetical protein
LNSFENKKKQQNVGKICSLHEHFYIQRPEYFKANSFFYVLLGGGSWEKFKLEFWQGIRIRA